MNPTLTAPSYQTPTHSEETVSGPTTAIECIQLVAMHCLQAPIKLARHFLKHPIQLLLIHPTIYAHAANAAQVSGKTHDSFNTPVLVGLMDYPLPQYYPKKNIYYNEKETVDGVDNDNNGCIDDISGCDFDQYDKKTGKFTGLTGLNSPKTVPFDHSSFMANILTKNRDLSIRILPLAYKEILQIKPILEYAEKMGCSITVRTNTQPVNPGTCTLPRCKEAMLADLAEGKSRLQIGHEYAEATMEKDIQGIENYNGLLIGSAGNLGYNTDRDYVFPVSHSFRNKNILYAGQVNRHGLLTKISNYGSHVKIAVRFDGEPLMGPCPDDPESECVTPPLPGFAKFDPGTSGAAATVARVAANIKQINPLLSPGRIKNILLTSGDAPPSDANGYVILNETRALRKARETLQTAPKNPKLQKKREL